MIIIQSIALCKRVKYSFLCGGAERHHTKNLRCAYPFAHCHISPLRVLLNNKVPSEGQSAVLAALRLGIFFNRSPLDYPDGERTHETLLLKSLDFAKPDVQSQQILC
jgi:hypothetical protein